MQEILGSSSPWDGALPHDESSRAQRAGSPRSPRRRVAGRSGPPSGPSARVAGAQLSAAARPIVPRGGHRNQPRSGRPVFAVPTYARPRTRRAPSGRLRRRSPSGARRARAAGRRHGTPTRSRSRPPRPAAARRRDRLHRGRPEAVAPAARAPQLRPTSHRLDPPVAQLHEMLGGRHGSRPLGGTDGGKVHRRHTRRIHHDRRHVQPRELGIERRVEVRHHQGNRVGGTGLDVLQP